MRGFLANSFGVVGQGIEISLEKEVWLARNVPIGDEFTKPCNLRQDQARVLSDLRCIDADRNGIGLDLLGQCSLPGSVSNNAANERPRG